MAVRKGDIVGFDSVYSGVMLTIVQEIKGGTMSYDSYLDCYWGDWSLFDEDRKGDDTTYLKPKNVDHYIPKEFLINEE